MDDQEYAWRRQAIARMSASCICAEEVPVKRGSVGRGRIDVLCKPKLQDLAKLTLAIEVKAHRVVGDRQLGPWLKQAPITWELDPRTAGRQLSPHSSGSLEFS